MPTNQAHPVGALGKDPLVSGIAATQAPQTVSTLIPGPISAPNGVKAMNMLIRMVILNNSYVRKLDAFIRMQRSDPDEASTVSDDKE